MYLGWKKKKLFQVLGENPLSLLILSILLPKLTEIDLIFPLL